MKRLVMVGLSLVALSGLSGCRFFNDILGLTDHSDSPAKIASRQVTGTIPDSRSIPFNTLGGGVRSIDTVEVAPAATPTQFQTTRNWNTTTTGGRGTASALIVGVGQPGDAIRITLTAFVPQ